MKNRILIVLVVSFLLQSCFTYKSIENDSNPIVIGQTYKIIIGKKDYKGTLVSFNDSLTTLKIVNKERVFKAKDIQLMEKRKFSVVKTIALPVAIIVGFVGLFVLTFNPNIQVGSPTPN